MSDESTEVDEDKLIIVQPNSETLPRENEIKKNNSLRNADGKLIGIRCLNCEEKLWPDIAYQCQKCKSNILCYGCKY